MQTCRITKANGFTLNTTAQHYPGRPSSARRVTGFVVVMAALLAVQSPKNTAFGDLVFGPTTIGAGLADIPKESLRPGVDLSRKCFYGTRLAEFDLSGAIFGESDFGGAVFEYCNLTGASFRNAKLSGAKFLNCTISDADFENAEITEFYFDPELAEEHFAPQQIVQTRSWREKRLSGFRLSRSSLGDHADLRGFDLRRTLFNQVSDFRDVQFDRAQIAGADFSGTLDFEQLRNTVEVARGAFPAKYYCSVADCDLSNLDLRTAKLQFPPGVKVNLANANIDDCAIYFDSNRSVGLIESTWSYKQGRLRSLRLYGGDFSRVSFDNMILDYVSFSGANLPLASFVNAVVIDSDFDSGKRGEALTVEQLRQTYNAKHGQLSEFRYLPEQMIRELEADR